VLIDIPAVTLGVITTLQWYLAVHILAAVLWVGTNFATQVYAIRAQRSGDSGYIGALLGDVEWLGTRILIPTSLTLVVFGFLLKHEEHLGWPSWLTFGLLVWIASFVAGAGFLGPESGRIQKTIAEKGIESEEAKARISRIFLVSRVELVLLILAVLAMTLKPGS
jgi:uncharacterized membrane protein